MIVAAIVAVWMLFNWLAHMGSDPAQELEIIQRGSKSRWLAAKNLAQQLHEDRLQDDKHRTGKYCNDPVFCKKIAAALQQAIERDSYKDEEELQVRFFLASAMVRLSSTMVQMSCSKRPRHSVLRKKLRCRLRSGFTDQNRHDVS